ncbi:hypothetical protein ACHAW6_002040 [Cyclotella cf. meneghiniana]
MTKCKRISPIKVHTGTVEAQNKSNPIYVSSRQFWNPVCWKGKSDALDRIIERILYHFRGLGGSKYIGLTLDWDYKEKQVHLSMLGYVDQALKLFGHENQGNAKISPTNIP